MRPPRTTAVVRQQQPARLVPVNPWRRPLECRFRRHSVHHGFSVHLFSPFPDTLHENGPTLNNQECKMVCFFFDPVILLQIHGCDDITRHLLTAANSQLKCLLQSWRNMLRLSLAPVFAVCMCISRSTCSISTRQLGITWMLFSNINDNDLHSSIGNKKIEYAGSNF